MTGRVTCLGSVHDEKNQTGIIALAKKQYRKTAYLNLLSFRYAVCVYEMHHTTCFFWNVLKYSNKARHAPRISAMNWEIKIPS